MTKGVADVWRFLHTLQVKRLIQIVREMITPNREAFVKIDLSGLLDARSSRGRKVFSKVTRCKRVAHRNDKCPAEAPRHTRMR